MVVVIFNVKVGDATAVYNQVLQTRILKAFLPRGLVANSAVLMKDDLSS